MFKLLRKFNPRSLAKEVKELYNSGQFEIIKEMHVIIKEDVDKVVQLFNNDLSPYESLKSEITDYFSKCVKKGKDAMGQPVRYE